MGYGKSYRVLTTIIKVLFLALPEEINARVPRMKLSSQSRGPLKALALVNKIHLCTPETCWDYHGGPRIQNYSPRSDNVSYLRLRLHYGGLFHSEAVSTASDPISCCLPLWRTQSLSGSWLISWRKWSGCNIFLFGLITFETAIYPSPLAGPIETIY